MPAFLLPDLGEGLTEAEIVAWHVRAGDTVTVDQRVAEVETAKAVVEVPVPFAGRVTELHGTVGDVVAVGAPLITVEAAPPRPRAPWERLRREDAEAGRTPEREERRRSADAGMPGRRERGKRLRRGGRLRRRKAATSSSGTAPLAPAAAGAARAAPLPRPVAGWPSRRR